MTVLEPTEPDDLELRPASEVAIRCLALYAVTAAGHGEPREKIVKWLRDEGLWGAVTSEERSFLKASAPSRQQGFNASWRIEAVFALLWALGHIPDMPRPETQCDMPLAQRLLPPPLGKTAKFRAGPQLRDELEVWAALDEIIEMHWTFRDAQLNNRPTPEGLMIGVVMERHHALRWLTDPETDWDEVTLDT